MDREPDTRPMSEEQFFDWAEGREGRYELVEGIVMMHAGATRDHERVAKRIFALLYAAVDETRFDVNKGDFGVRIRPGQGKVGRRFVAGAGSMPNSRVIRPGRPSLDGSTGSCFSRPSAA